MSKRKTHEEYVEELKIKNPTVEVVGKYVDAKTNIMHHCLIHDVYWKAQPTSILRGSGCDMCRKEKIGASEKKNKRTICTRIKAGESICCSIGRIYWYSYANIA